MASMISPTIQAICLGAASNIIAQLITSQREGRELFSISFAAALPFAFYAVLSTPLNMLWQEYLESKFPGSAEPVPAARLAEGSEKEQGKEPKPKQELKDSSHPKKTPPVRNTLIKLFLDQTIGASINTVGFIAYMASLQPGAGIAYVSSTISHDFWPIMRAGWKLWPLVSLLNFTLVPVQQRVVVASLVGMFWGVYLSLMAASSPSASS